MRGAWIFNRTFDDGYGAIVGGWFCSLLQPRGFVGQSVGPLVPYNAHVARDPLDDDLAVERFLVMLLTSLLPFARTDVRAWLSVQIRPL